MSQKKIRLQIITPQKPVLDKEVDFVAIPAFNGEMGILPGHISYIAQLQYGVLRYKCASDKEEGVFAVMGGFAEIERDSVSVFAEAAALAEEIDEEEEKQKIAQAKASLTSKDADVDLAVAEMELKKSILLLKVKKNKF